MIAVDTNILVYAHRADSPFHAAALPTVSRLIQSQAQWAVPWPCFHEFVGVVTHPRVYAPPTPLATALDAVAEWLKAPNLVMLAEADDYWRELCSVATVGRIAGAKIHDARIVAICLQHGISELWSADRDFSRFPTLKVTNPLLTQ